MPTLLVIWSWCLAHPAIVWPVLTLIVTSAFGASEKYAATHPALAKFLSVLETVGLDGPGVLKLLRGKLVPPAAILTLLLLACSATQVQHRTDEGAQATELAGCIAKAKAIDAGKDERWAVYSACADDVDAKHGLLDGGAK